MENQIQTPAITNTSVESEVSNTAEVVEETPEFSPVEWFIELGGKPVKEIKFDKVDIEKELVKTISFDQFIDRVQRATRKEILIKEVVVESNVALAKSLVRMRDAYLSEAHDMIDEMKYKYKMQVEKLEKLARETFVGETLIKLNEAIDKIGWSMHIKGKKIYLYKFYNPPFPVTEGYKDGNAVIYMQPTCYLKGIYLDAMYHKVGGGAIMLTSEGRHPNCQHEGFGNACTGTLNGRDIPIGDVKGLKTLLKEIATVYEKVHIDSAYFKPQIKYKINKKGNLWTT
jgi:hypothetical protein